jgi:LacI family transcriptional regulator
MAVTIREIAEISGVCRATVDKIIHERAGVKEATRKRVKQIMADLNYTPNIAGKALRLRQKKITIGVVLYRGNSLSTLLDGIKNQLRDYEAFGLNTEIKVVNYSEADRQALILEEFASGGVSGVIVSPLYNDRVLAAMSLLAEKNIPVITINTDIPGSARSCFIGEDSMRAGRTAAHLMAKFMGGQGTLAIISGSMNFLSETRRLFGFTELLEQDYPGIQVLETVQTGEEPVVVYRETARLLHEYPDLGGIFISSGGVHEAGRAVSALGFAGRVSIISFDLYDEIRELVQQGVIDCTIGQNLYQQGAHPVQLFFQYFFYNRPLPAGEIFTPIDIRIRENINYPLNC